MISPLERATQDRMIQLFKDLGYHYYGNWEDRQDNSNIEAEYLAVYLKRQGYSPRLIEKSIQELQQLATTNSGNLYERNKTFYERIRYGVKVREEIGEQYETVFPIDWLKPQNNDFAIAEEVTLNKGENTRRPDIVLYINGIAIGVLELKRGTADINESVNQLISNQRETFNEWFYSTIQLLLAGNNTQGLRYGTTQTENKYFLAWKEDEQIDEGYKLDKYLKRMCNRERLIDFIYNGIVFDAGTKKIPRPHQYFGLQASRAFVSRGEGGIIWHTQGSGKSLLMVMLGKWILENVPNSRLVILTDRTELDEQIGRVYRDAGETDIAQAQSGKELMQFLTSATPRLISSLVHKFGNRSDTDFNTFLRELKANPLPTQGRIFVFVDEAHRTQSGKLNQAMKAVLHDAVFIGFTGTPLLKADAKTTMDVFGRFIHTYKFNEAVRDGVVKDLMYEGRNIEQRLSSPERVDEWFDRKTAGLNDFQRNEIKKKWGTMQKVLSSKSRMQKIVADILFDFNTKARLNEGTGNAILVASSIYEACKYYTLFKETELKNKCAVITSYNPNASDISLEDTGDDSETDKEFVYNTYMDLLKDVSPQGNKSKTETYEDISKKRFRDTPAQMKLLIVVSKLLTGFDAPPCTYIYIDKKMQDHTLFQAICRVNRLDTDDKRYGYIVDYMELFGKVTNAIDVYTSELESEGFTQEETEIQMKERLKVAEERLVIALESVESIIENVPAPKDEQDYIRYFCGNTEIATDLRDNEYKRVGLYKAIVEYIRAFTGMKADFVDSSFSEKEIARFEHKMKDYLNLRTIIRKASGETIDLKAYEADMRFLIDTYIGAEEANKFTPFEDLSILELIELNPDKDIMSFVPESIRNNKDAVAETIENNIRSKIVEQHLLDPKYFNEMSILLQELIELRKNEQLTYEENLKKLAEMMRKVNRGRKDDLPEVINTRAKAAIYNVLGEDEELAVLCDEAIQYGKQDGFRDNPAKENQIKSEIYKVVKDKQKVEEIFKIVKEHKDEY